jgi:hypothetical protein
MEKLGRFLGAFFGAFLCIVLLMGIYSIAEDITLTTYYPAPYGAYDELTVTGNVGIGTTDPLETLHVQGRTRLSFSNSDGGLIKGETTSDTVQGFLSLGYSTDFISSGEVGLWSAGNSDLRLGTNSLERMTIDGDSGYVGIGMASPNYRLDVAGDINTTGDVRKNGAAYINPDYVFEPGYSLMNIVEVKSYVFENKHLPNMPSTGEIKKDGVKLFEQNRLLLEKLEEAYLYIFKLDERISKLESIVQKER